MALKKAQFAGSWYPGSSAECLRSIREFEDGLDVDSLPASMLGKLGFAGAVVPHAGWYFSGKTAYSVFRSIDRDSQVAGRRPDLFFIFGMHMRRLESNKIFMDEGLETPLGPITVNRNTAERMSQSFEFSYLTASNPLKDNTIELQLPFIRYLFPDAEVVALGVAPDERALVIGKRAFEISQELGKTACFVGSTDLTHYGPGYRFTPQGTGNRSLQWVRKQNDREIIDAILTAGPDDILKRALASNNACCPGAAAAAVAAVRGGGASEGKLVEYTTSYEKNPDSNFVGYAGVVF